MSDLPTIGDLNPFDEDFNSQERRNQIRATVIAFISSGASKAQALSVYRSAGLGIRSSDFSAIYDEVSDADTQSRRIKYVNKSLYPTEKILAEARINIPNKYRFVGSLRLKNNETGEIETAIIGWDTDNLYSIADIEQGISDFFMEFDSNSKYEVLESTIEKGFIKLDK